MAKYRKVEIRQLKTALRWKIPDHALATHADGVAAREWNDAACDCRDPLVHPWARRPMSRPSDAKAATA